MNQPKERAKYQDWTSLFCMAFLLLCNLIAYIHLMTHARTSRSESSGKYAFFTTYFLYMLLQGVLAPVFVVLSIQSLSEYFKQQCKEVFGHMFALLFTRRKNKVSPELFLKTLVVVDNWKGKDQPDVLVLTDVCCNRVYLFSFFNHVCNS